MGELQVTPSFPHLQSAVAPENGFLTADAGIYL